MSLFVNKRGSPFRPTRHKHEDKDVNTLISEVLRNSYKRKEMQLLKKYQDGTISRDELISQISKIIDIYESHKPDEATTEKFEFYRWQAICPYNVDEMNTLLDKDGAIDVGIKLISVIDFANKKCAEKFSLFNEIDSKYPKFFESIILGGKPYSEEISALENKYYSLIYKTPESTFKGEGTNMSLSDYSKNIDKFRQNIEKLTEEIDILKENHNAKSQLSPSDARSSIQLSKDIDMRQVELANLVKQYAISLLEFADSEKNDASIVAMQDIKQSLKAYKEGTYNEFEPVCLKKEDLDMLFSSDEFREATELVVDIYNQRYRGLITQKYKIGLESKNPKFKAETEEKYNAEVEIANKRRNAQRATHYTKAPKDGYVTIEDYIAELKRYQTQVKDEENEASYEYVDSSELIFLIEKMNHNLRNIAQVKAASQLRAGEKVSIPEGDYTPEEMDRLFESPSARKLTAKMIETNEKMYERVYSVTEKYQDKKDKMPVELLPYEKLQEKLDFVHRCHMTSIAGPKTVEKYFPTAEHRNMVYDDFSTYLSHIKPYKDTVHSLEDVGYYPGSDLLSFPLSSYKLMLDNYCEQNNIEIDHAKTDEKSQEIKSMPRKDKKVLAEQIKAQRELKAYRDSLREKLREDEKNYAGKSNPDYDQK